MVRNLMKIPAGYTVELVIGDYTFANNYETMEFKLFGKTAQDLLQLPRTDVSIAVLKGEEIFEQGGSKHYDVEPGKVYFRVNILAPAEDGEVPSYLFESAEDASNFQFNILAFKSNAFFGELEDGETMDGGCEDGPCSCGM